MDTSLETTIKNTRMHQIVSWSLIIGLFLLRIPLLGFGDWLARAPWENVVCQIGTYLLTAIFLLWECKNLKDFHVDALALWLIVLFKPVMTLILNFWGITDPFNPFNFPNIPSLLIWIIAIGLAIALWTQRKNLPKFEWKSLGWFGIGILIGIGSAILLAIPTAFQVDRVSPATFWSFINMGLLTAFCYQIGYAAILEEPFFRGFLWGMLRKAGWKEVWIWLFQAALFMLGHIFYLGRANGFLSFFIVIPACGLILGLIAWKSRRISASMAAHATINDLTVLIGGLAAYYIK
jgi:membrane protease YdiL (CAAX protease family)